MKFDFDVQKHWRNPSGASKTYVKSIKLSTVDLQSNSPRSDREGLEDFEIQVKSDNFTRLLLKDQYSQENQLYQVTR